MPAWSEILGEVQRLMAAGDPQAFDKTRRKYVAAVSAHTGRDTILYASKWVQGSSSPAACMVKVIENDRGRAFIKIERQVQIQVAPRPAPPQNPAPPAPPAPSPPTA